jgi:hypothetical protein
LLERCATDAHNEVSQGFLTFPGLRCDADGVRVGLTYMAKAVADWA